MAEIKDEVFINFGRKLIDKLTEVVINIDIESIDLYKSAYELGRADERAKALDEVKDILNECGSGFVGTFYYNLLVDKLGLKEQK